MKTIKLEITITSIEEGREAQGGFVATVNIHGDALKTFIQNNLILAGFLDCEPDDFHVTVEFGPHQHLIDGQAMVTGLWHAFVISGESMNTLRLVPHLEAGKSLVAAFLEIPEKFRPTKVNQFRRALCLDKNTRPFYVANPYAKLIVLAEQFPPTELLAFARRNNL